MAVQYERKFFKLALQKYKKMNFASTITRLARNVCAIVVLIVPASPGLYAQHDAIKSHFLLRKQKLSLEIYNQSNDSLNLPSQAYWKVLGDSAVSVSGDTLFINFVEEVATIEVFGDTRTSIPVYLSDMLIRSKENRALEYKVKNVKLRPNKITTLILYGNGHFILESSKLSKRLIRKNRCYPISKIISFPKRKKMYLQ